MPDLPPEIYLSIASVMAAVIGLLWKRMSDLYAELIKDSRSLEAIHGLIAASADRDERILQAVSMVASRLESLRSSNVSPPETR